MADFVDIDSLNTLIKAVQNYQEELETNRLILLNAANVCDAAMGSDAIAQKHISRLYTALEELQKTAQLAENVASALVEDRRLAIEAYED